VSASANLSLTSQIFGRAPSTTPEATDKELTQRKMSRHLSPSN